MGDAVRAEATAEGSLKLAALLALRLLGPPAAHRWRKPRGPCTRIQKPSLWLKTVKSKLLGAHSENHFAV